MQIFENFISYRRKDASLEVRNIYDELIKKGYSTFCDVYSMKSGYFDEHLKQVIDTCTNFILVVSQASLDSCKSENDWLYLEIKEAIDNRKNIIPVFLGDVTFPDSMPADIQNVRFHNAITFDILYFDKFIDNLISMFLVNNGEVEDECHESDFLIQDNTLIKYLGNGRRIKIPEGVVHIGYRAFKDKTRIQKIIFPDSLETIEESAFERCLNLTYLFFPLSLQSIGEKAFKRCFNISYIEFNNQLKNIGPESFSYCNQLKYIRLNNNIEFVDSSAFNNCSQLTGIYIENNPYYTDINGVLYNKDKTAIVRCPEAYKTDIFRLPETVTTIEKWAFYQCSQLFDIILPQSLKEIKAYAFKDCYNIESLSVFEDIQVFDVTALDGWTEKQNVKFSNRCNQLIRYNVSEKLKNNYSFSDSKLEYPFILVKTTFESRKEAENMARMLLDRKLIVSGQISKLHSIYMWHDTLNEEDEVELSCFTMGAIYPKVEAFIKSNHSYETCQILSIPIIMTTPEFGKWITDYLMPENEN